jgi:hypothetical protein
MVLFATMATLATRPAYADPPSSTLQPKSQGWIVIALSLAAGAVLTAVSSTIKCDPGDLMCTRWASLGIWGGIGIASTGSVVGLLFVETDSRAQQVSALPAGAWFAVPGLSWGGPRSSAGYRSR